MKKNKKRSFKNILVDPSFQLKVVLITVSVVLLQALVTTGYFIITSHRFFNETLPGLTDPIAVHDALKGMYVQLLIAFTVANIDCLIVATVLSLYLSHRTAGPNYAIKRAINSILEGVEHHTITLRKGDEFHDLAERINHLFADMKGRCDRCADNDSDSPDQG